MTKKRKSPGKTGRVGRFGNTTSPLGIIQVYIEVDTQIRGYVVGKTTPPLEIIQVYIEVDTRIRGGEDHCYDQRKDAKTKQTQQLLMADEQDPARPEAWLHNNLSHMQN